METSISSEALHRRALRWTVLLLTPTALLLWLTRPRWSVIYVSFEPFEVFSNAPSPRLPQFIGELVTYYRGTAATVLVAIVAALIARRGSSARPHPRPPLIWYAPVLVAGLEAVRHVVAVLSRHYWAESPTLQQLRSHWGIAGLASLSAAALCVLAGLLAAKVSRSAIGFPAFNVAVPLSIASLWTLLIAITVFAAAP